MNKTEKRFYELWNEVSYSYAIEQIIKELEVVYIRVFGTYYENRIALMNENQNILGDLPEYMEDNRGTKDVLKSLMDVGAILITR